MMEMPLIFDIKRSSFEDGPGIRTTVFLKGCNLDCRWCHNPEGKLPGAQLAVFAEKCIGCGSCRKICGSPENCVVCGECAENCPAQARKVYGKHWPMDELFGVIAADRDYYLATGGGVTFSGGECMLYPDFLAEIASRCRAAGISVAIDTAGNVPWDHFEKILPWADLFLYDIKALDPELHRRGTGCTNERILENLDRILERGKPVIIRTPCIPGFNDGEELEKIRKYCRDRGLRHEVLEYHSFGESKQAALETAKK